VGLSSQLVISRLFIFIFIFTYIMYIAVRVLYNSPRLVCGHIHMCYCRFCQAACVSMFFFVFLKSIRSLRLWGGRASMYTATHIADLQALFANSDSQRNITSTSRLLEYLNISIPLVLLLYIFLSHSLHKAGDISPDPTSDSG